MARKKANEGSGGPNWLDTYADMVTLLLTFFVLLFSFSTIDSTKWAKLVEALANKVPSSQTSEQIVLDAASANTEVGEGLIAAGGSGNSETSSGTVKNFEDLYEYLKDYSEKTGMGDSINVYKGDDYTFIVFQNSIFFDGDSAVVRQEGKDVLDYLCDGFAKISDQIGEIRVYGHTAEVNASMTVAQRISDWELSGKRAVNVATYIDLKNIISSAKLQATGRGQFQPLVPHDGTEATRIKNRRVEMYIQKINNVDTTLEDIYAKINAAGVGNADFSTSKGTTVPGGTIASSASSTNSSGTTSVNSSVSGSPNTSSVTNSTSSGG